MDFCIIFDRGKLKNESEKIRIVQFFGPATNCEELLRIGYTRNGFYLVKGGATSKNSHVEIVDCVFKHPNGVEEGVRNKNDLL